MRSVVALILGLIVFGCSKSDPPSPPDAANLVFPEQNSECTTGVDQSDTTSEVEFRWQASANTDSYELRVTQLLTNTTTTATSTTTSARLTIDKGAPYSWRVISSSDAVETTATSSTWQFYNAGSQTTYAPFPATILTPEPGANVSIDSNGEVTLTWSGADVDNDIAGYDVYHGAVDPPTEIIATTNFSNRQVKVSVDPGAYYWKVITKDREGNTSDSGVYSYRAF